MRWLAVIGLALVVAAPISAEAKYGEREVAELIAIAEAEKQPEARRAKAIRELEHTELRTHLSLLRKLIREERSLDVRLACALTLAAHGDRKAPRDLLLVCAYDRSRTPNCPRSDVFLALGRIGESAGELSLSRALEEPAPPDEPYFYHDLCRALSLLDTPNTRRLLLQALGSNDNPALRHAAVSPLAAIATDRDSPERQAAAEALVRAARSDEDEKVAEQAASALLWSAVDGPAFFRMLTEEPDPRLRARAARVMDRHLLNAARLARLRAALERETDQEVRRVMEATLASQTQK